MTEQEQDLKEEQQSPLVCKLCGGGLDLINLEREFGKGTVAMIITEEYECSGCGKDGMMSIQSGPIEGHKRTSGVASGDGGVYSDS